MTPMEQSRQVIELLKPKLLAEGYTVYVEPSENFLPAFMGTFRPAAIAIGAEGRKNLAFDFTVEGRARSQDDLAALKRLFDESADWELRLLHARPNVAPPWPAPVSILTIRNAIERVEQLLQMNQLPAALLCGWACLEALATLYIAPGRYRPRTAAGVLEFLAFEGYVTPSEADLLRKLDRIRTTYSQGGLDADIVEGDIRSFVDILKIVQSLDETHDSGIANIA